MTRTIKNISNPEIVIEPNVMISNEPEIAVNLNVFNSSHISVMGFLSFIDNFQGEYLF